MDGLPISNSSDVSIHPDSIKDHVTEDQFKLYDLIWRRTISSQMANAETNLNALTITNPEESIQLKATLGKLVFDGFKKLYNLQEEGEEQSFSVLVLIKSIDSLERDILSVLIYVIKATVSF